MDKALRTFGLHTYTRESSICRFLSVGARLCTSGATVFCIYTCLKTRPGHAVIVPNDFGSAPLNDSGSRVWIGDVCDRGR